jgi:hypothetical protein
MKENKWLELDYSENLKEDFKRLINENSNNKIYIKLIDRNRNKIILIEDLSFAGIKKLQITSGFQDFEKIVFKNCVFGNLELIHDTFGNSIFFDDSRSEKDSRILLEESLVMHQIRVEIIRKEIELEKIDGEESKSKLKLNIKNNNQYYDEDKFLSIETGIPVEIISDKSQLYLKNCIFKTSNKIILNKYSDNRFEGCEFKGLKNEININNLLRNNFKKCTFEGNDLIINGLKEERLFNIEIEGGIFNLNFIKINRASINFKNVNFQCAKFFVEKNEDLEHEFGLMKISSNLFFSGGDYNFFELTDFGSNSFKFRNCNNINYLGFENGAEALELFNCIIKKFTINGEITDKTIFNKVTFENPPEIGDIKFKNCNVEFRDIKFIDKKTPEAIAGFRALNKACRDANYHHGEIFFHGLTLEGIGKNLKYKSDFVEKLLSDAYEVFSDFGRSVNRPLLWLLILGFIFFGINYYEINKINNLKLSENSVINKSIVENNNNFEEEQNQLNKINKKIVIRNAIGPLRIALPKDFIEDNEEKLFKEKINSDFIYFNIIHAFLSLGIWSIWLFMIRARFKL